MVFKLQVLLLNGQVSRDIHISIYICMCVYDEVFHRALFRPCALHSFSSFLRGEEKKARANLKLAKTPTGKIVLLEKNASCRHWLQQFSFRSTMTRFLGKRYKKKKEKQSIKYASIRSSRFHGTRKYSSAFRLESRQRT